MKKKRILLLAGLSSVHTIKWANALVDYGYDVHVVSQQTPVEKLDSRVKTYLLPNRGGVGYFLMVPFVRRLIKKIMPGVINAHYASGYGTTARLSGFPYLLSVWGSDVYRFPYKSKLHHYLIRKNLSSATIVASTSEAMAGQIRSITNNIDCLEITPFGVDCSVFRPAEYVQNKPFIIGTVKGLKKIYGVDILIRSFAEVLKKRPSVPLILRIVGSGPIRLELERLVQDLGIESSVEFIGAVVHAKVPEYLRSFSIYTALSRSESFGVAVIEASACGLPVVVSDVGGLPEVVIANQTGYIVESENVKSTVDALVTLIDSESKRLEMGFEGRRYVKDNYSWDLCVRKFCDILEKQYEIQKKALIKYK